MANYSNSKLGTFLQCRYKYKLQYVDKVKTGDKVKITNGFVSEFRGEKQLSTGRFGKLEVVEKGKPSAAVKPGVEEDFVE